MNKFFHHSELRDFSLQMSKKYFAQVEHIEKMMADECQYELERLELKNTYNNRAKIIEDMQGRIRSWVEEMNTKEEITSEKLATYRLPYLYFTRLYKK